MISACSSQHLALMECSTRAASTTLPERCVVRRCACRPQKGAARARALSRGAGSRPLHVGASANVQRAACELASLLSSTYAFSLACTSTT